MNNLMEAITFERGATHIAASALEYIGNNNQTTNDEDAVIYLVPDTSYPPSPTRPRNLGGMTNLVFDVSVGSGSPALADFALYVFPHRNYSAAHKILSATDWGTITGILKHKVGTIQTLAAGASAYAYVDIGPNYAIAFGAKSGATELLTNGTFTGNANSWTLGAGWAYGANKVAATAASSTLKQLKADMVGAGATWTSGKLYELGFTISSYSAGYLTYGTNTGPSTDSDGNASRISADGTYTGLLVESDGNAAGLVLTGVGFTGTIDSVTLKQCAEVSVVGSLYR